MTRGRRPAVALVAATVVIAAAFVLAWRSARDVGRTTRLPFDASPPLPPGAVLRIGRRPRFHGSDGLLAVFPDGSACVTASGPGAVCVWDLPAETLRAEFRVFGGDVEPKSNRRVVEALLRAVGVGVLAPAGPPSFASVSPHGRLLAVADGAALRVIDLADDGRVVAQHVAETTQMGACDFLTDLPSVAFHADLAVWRWDVGLGRDPVRGSDAASAAEGRVLVALGSGTRASIRRADTDPVETPDGRFRVAFDVGRLRRTRADAAAVAAPSAQTAADVRALAVHRLDAAPTAVAVRPGRAEVAVARIDGTVDLVRIPDGAVLRTIAPAGAETTTLAWSEDGSRLLVGRDREAWEIRGVADGALLGGPFAGHVCRATLAGDDVTGIVWHDGPARAVRLPGPVEVPLRSPRGSEPGDECVLTAHGRCVAGISSLRRLTLWDVDSGEVVEAGPEASWDCAVAASRSGDFVAAATRGAVVVWRRTTGVASRHDAAETPTPTTSTSRAPAAAMSADGRRFAVAFGRSVHALHLDPVHLIAVLDGHREDVTSLSFSDDGRWLVSLAEGEPAIVWDVDAAAAAAAEAKR